MEIFYKKTKLIARLKTLRADKTSIGFVPTMGALHKGHLSLIKKGLSQNNSVVVSIFVNPTQFNTKKDLINYPRTLDTDIEILSALKGETLMVYAPSTEDIYGTTTTSEGFNFGGLEHEMEGRYRTGHFNGVGTIVKRLFSIVKPNYAYFGEKDFQQLQIIKKLVALYDIPTTIIGCPIHRTKDGLAMSSRNMRLTKAHRKVAPFIYKTLQTAKIKFGTKSAKYVTEWVKREFAKQPLLELEYFSIANTETLKAIKRKSAKKTYRAFIAVYAGGIRLIDNIALN